MRAAGRGNVVGVGVDIHMEALPCAAHTIIYSSDAIGCVEPARNRGDVHIQHPKYTRMHWMVCRKYQLVVGGSLTFGFSVRGAAARAESHDAGAGGRGGAGVCERLTYHVKRVAQLHPRPHLGRTRSPACCNNKTTIGPPSSATRHLMLIACRTWEQTMQHKHAQQHR